MDKIIITGLCRSVEPYISATISNMEKVASLFKEYVIIIYENNSNDNTRDILLEWKSNNNNVHLILEDDNLDPIRTNRLAHGRNQLIKYCEEHGFMDEYPYLLMMDMDDIGSQPDFPYQNIPICMQDLDTWDVLCGNTGYDVWALRSNTCNYDCWLMADYYANTYGRKIADDLFVNQHKRVYSEDSPCIEVTSAYGGISIFKTDILKGCRYTGTENGVQVCDTYTICMRIKEKGGRICIHPKLKNKELCEVIPENYTNKYKSILSKKTKILKFLPTV